jgi:hypothetical protein
MIFSKLPNKAVTTPEVAVLVQGMRSEKAFAVTKTGDIKMSGKFLARASALSLAFVLAACGGGDESSPLSGLPGGGSTDGGSTAEPDPNTETAIVTSLQLRLSQPTIGTSGNDTATITAIAKDENSILLEGATVRFSIPSANGTLLSVQDVTGEQGTATANISADGDFTNRTIEIQARAGDITESVTIEATGTRLSINGPSNIALGDNASYNVSLLDSDGRGIANQPINITAGSNSVDAPLATNASGQATAVVSAESSGTYTLRATASGISMERSFTVSGESFTLSQPAANTEIELNELQAVVLQWSQDGEPVEGEEVQFTTEKGFFAESGTNTYITSANAGEATATLQSTQSGKSTVQIQSRESGLSTSIEVEFVATNPTQLKLNASKTQLLTGESSDITVIARDANGNLVKNAVVTFSLSEVTGGRLTTLSDTTDTAGAARTSYIASDVASDKDAITITATVAGSLSESINLTVGGQALTIIIGTGNTLDSEGQTFYNQPWGIQVTDANGNSVGNQRVELSVLPAQYRKGFYVDVDPDPDSYDWQPTFEAFCTPENAIPAGSDRNIANPASTPSSIFTDADGKFEFGVEYTKAQCNWARVKLTATAEVDGKESTSTQTFTLPCLNEDLKSSMPPGGVSSFYGESNDCSTTD